MKIAKNDVPVKIDVPGATARQKTGFGSVAGYGQIGAEYFTLGAGTDMAPLLHGLEGDLCQCPHWGYVLEGAITATFDDGQEETSQAGDLFYWPPGHTIKAEQDSEMVLFSPEKEHTHVMEHVLDKING